jgi:hypothetical protein
MVTIFCASLKAETGVAQARVATPSTCTVQAPHCAMPQPYLVPDRSSCSRRTQSSGVVSLDFDLDHAAIDVELCHSHPLQRPRLGGRGPTRGAGSPAHPGHGSFLPESYQQASARSNAFWRRHVLRGNVTMKRVPGFTRPAISVPDSASHEAANQPQPDAAGGMRGRGLR